MFVVTNREFRADKSGLDQFGKKPNTKGPNELRLARVERNNNDWSINFCDDRLLKEHVKKLQKEFKLNIDINQPHYASLGIACELARLARKQEKHILFFIHGYNNDLEDVLKTAEQLEERYNVLVLIFSWPADGGGISGVMNYKSDKRDARASAGALDRVLDISFRYFQLITEAHRLELYERAGKKFPDNSDSRENYYVQLLEEDCPFTVNALFHSMGNYLLKQVLKSTSAEGNHLLFDNIILCQADTNNLDHELWVDKLQFRNRLYVTINENDFALSASRAKAGSEQLVRLGHYPRNLTSRNAYYLNVTDASWCKKSHSPFREPSEKNKRLEKVFKKLFSGESPESELRYFAEGNYFGIRS